MVYSIFPHGLICHQVVTDFLEVVAFVPVYFHCCWQKLESKDKDRKSTLATSTKPGIIIVLYSVVFTQFKLEGKRSICKFPFWKLKKHSVLTHI